MTFAHQFFLWWKKNLVIYWHFLVILLSFCESFSHMGPICPATINYMLSWEWHQTVWFSFMNEHQHYWVVLKAYMLWLCDCFSLSLNNEKKNIFADRPAVIGFFLQGKKREREEGFFCHRNRQAATYCLVVLYFKLLCSEILANELEWHKAQLLFDSLLCSERNQTHKSFIWQDYHPSSDTNIFQIWENLAIVVYDCKNWGGNCIVSQ